MNAEVFVTGASLASCLGSSVELCVDRIVDNLDGLSYDHPFAKLTDACLGPIEGDPRQSLNQRFETLAFQMIDELANKTSVKYYSPERVGLFVGTTTLGVQGFQQAVEGNRRDPAGLMDSLREKAQLEWLCQKLKSRLGLKGPSATIVTSCSSGAVAIAQGFDLVKSGILDACVVGGLDLLTTKTVKGFESLQILAKEKCQPFRGKVNGINLSDGGALMVLEREPGSKPIGKLLGYSVLSEAYHMVQPAPEGSIMARTMVGALNHSGVSSHEVDYINSHGTGTFSNDKNEKFAIKQVFGNDAYFDSLKAWLGHSLAGSAPLELVIGARLLKRRATVQSLVMVKNSFGFGGTDASLVMEVL